MPRIQTVEPMGDVLSVTLDNGHALMLPVEALLSLPEFAPLAEDDRIFYPHTDGACIYWKHGARIGLDEIIALLGGPSSRK